MNYGCVIGIVNDITLKVVPCSHDDFFKKDEIRKMDYVEVKTDIDNIEVLKRSGLNGNTYIYFNDDFKQSSPD